MWKEKVKWRKKKKKILTLNYPLHIYPAESGESAGDTHLRASWVPWRLSQDPGALFWAAQLLW